jgi:tetratricopeptide (TPR) repeat protein
MPGDTEDLLRRFREAFRAHPAAAYRDWFRLQEELRDREDAAPLARALADDLWSLREELTFPSAEEEARFVHNAAVFYGTSGPAADLARARDGFAAALAHYSEHEDAGWRARILHNHATSLSNLGASAEDLAEAVALFDQALEWRTSEREIARGVTLHNLAIALRRLARLDPEGAGEHLGRSEESLREAVSIRSRHGLAEGHALSLFHLGLTLEALSRTADARSAFRHAAEEFARLGKHDSAAIARERSAEGEPPED